MVKIISAASKPQSSQKPSSALGEEDISLDDPRLKGWADWWQKELVDLAKAWGERGPKVGDKLPGNLGKVAEVWPKGISIETGGLSAAGVEYLGIQKQLEKLFKDFPELGLAHEVELGDVDIVGPGRDIAYYKVSRK